MWTKLGLGDKSTDENEMKAYVADLRKICGTLFEREADRCGMQQFDLLDAYLWRMGKFSHGNLSLMLERTEYVRFITNLGLQAKKDELLPDYAKRMRCIYCDKPLTGKKRVKIADNPNTVNVDNLVLCEFVADKKDPFCGISNHQTLDAIYKHWKENYK